MLPFRTKTVFAFAICWIGHEALAQKIDYSLGARAGFAINRRNADFTSTTNQGLGLFRNESPRYVFGPTFEIGFKERFAVEFSPTFRREGQTVYTRLDSAIIPPQPPGSLALLSQFTRQTEHVWDFPLAGKYYFAKKDAKIRPFIGLGASASRHSQTGEVYSQFLTDTGGQSKRAFSNQTVQWGFGPVVSGGVSFRSGRFSIVPEFRYVRDSRSLYPDPRNRAEAFLGFRF
jgi:hypothetical protein